MPNWTENTIRVRGAPEDIRAFLEAVKGEDELFDFNRLIPMPAILKHTAGGGHVFEGAYHTSWFVENPDAPYGERRERPFTAIERAALETLGHLTWYDWAIQHWGTKWDACDARMSDDSSIKDGHVSIYFETAWSVPMPILEQVFERFPHLAIRWEWADEDDSYTRRHAIERAAVGSDNEVAA